MSRMYNPQHPGEVLREWLPRDDGNERGQGVAGVACHAFQGVERKGGSNGWNGLAPRCMAGHLPRCLAGDADTA